METEKEINEIKEEIKKIKDTLKEQEKWIKDLEKVIFELSSGAESTGQFPGPEGWEEKLWQKGEKPSFVSRKEEKKE
jgi:hypothetical protein